MSVRCATRARIEEGHAGTNIVQRTRAAAAKPAEGWRLEGGDSLGWPQIPAGAVCCDDEHDVKLAYRCWREWQARGDDLYRRCASARVCEALAEMELC
jgi:hypothetical protein